MTLRLSVPGNLLLAGEYAILEHGGMGVALAVEPRLTITAVGADNWSIEGRLGSATESWKPGNKPTFASMILQFLIDRFGAVNPAQLVIDSTAFFDGERKRGFGSSAALAAGLTAMTAALRRNVERLAGGLAAIAVEAHRHAQGGKGSGYDVMASWYGKYGLFTGGAAPSWQRLDASRLPALAVFEGPASVSTTSSIGLYEQWKAAHDSTDWFVAENNAAVGELAAASGEGWFFAAEKARDLGVIMGRAIGRQAELPRPEGLPANVFVKALGAGNETGLAASASPLIVPGVTPLILAEGLRWE